MSREAVTLPKNFQDRRFGIRLGYLSLCVPRKSHNDSDDVRFGDFRTIL